MTWRIGAVETHDLRVSKALRDASFIWKAVMNDVNKERGAE